MLGFEKDFSCHSHLGPIRIPPLFPFPSAPFPRNEKEDGTLELYYLSAYCLPKILLLQLVGHRVIQISRVFRGFPMLQLPYQFGGMDRLNIPLGSLVLTLLSYSAPTTNEPTFGAFSGTSPLPTIGQFLAHN